MARLGQPDLFTKRVRSLPPTPEFKLHVMVADVLAKWLMWGWRSNHIASGEYRPDATAGRLKRMGLIPGWSDFILLSPKPRTLAHFLELKRRGGKLSDHQKLFADYCQEHGYPFACVDRFDDAVAVLKQWGALRVSISA